MNTLPPSRIELDLRNGLERFGEFVLQCCEKITESKCVSVVTRRQAAGEGLRAAFCQVFLIAGLPAACLYGALGYEQAVQWIGDAIGLHSTGHYNPTLVVVGGIPIGMGLLWSCYLIRSDTDGKWRRLHWFYYGLFAFILMSCYGPPILFLAIAAVHFLFHFSIHLALEARNEEDPVDLPSDEPRAKTANLLEQYSGVTGFADAEVNPLPTPPDSADNQHT